jgi:hypothetical protein
MCRYCLLACLALLSVVRGDPIKNGPEHAVHVAHPKFDKSFSCGNKDTYPECFNHGDECYHCNECVHTDGIRWCESINLKRERRRDQAAGIKRKNGKGFEKHKVKNSHLPEEMLMHEHMHAEM